MLTLGELCDCGANTPDEEDQPVPQYDADTIAAAAVAAAAVAAMADPEETPEAAAAAVLLQMSHGTMDAPTAQAAVAAIPGPAGVPHCEMDMDVVEAALKAMNACPTMDELMSFCTW